MRFGTDGFRGPIETEITPEFCLNLGFHTGKIILEKGYDSVIIGKDIRVSGYMLESALQAGFISSGLMLNWLVQFLPQQFHFLPLPMQVSLCCYKCQP